jgi:hypothetical protein
VLRRMVLLSMRAISGAMTRRGPFVPYVDALGHEGAGAVRLEVEGMMDVRWFGQAQESQPHRSFVVLDPDEEGPDSLCWGAERTAQADRSRGGLSRRGTPETIRSCV